MHWSIPFLIAHYTKYFSKKQGPFIKNFRQIQIKSGSNGQGLPYMHYYHCVLLSVSLAHIQGGRHRECPSKVMGGLSAHPSDRYSS